MGIFDFLKEKEIADINLLQTKLIDAEKLNDLLRYELMDLKNQIEALEKENKELKDSCRKVEKEIAAINTQETEEIPIVETKSLLEPYNPRLDLENYNFPTIDFFDEYPNIEFTNYNLPILLGKDTDNKNIVLDLTEISHILISGSQGFGKTSLIHNIVVSILKTKHPTEVKFIFIDPRRIEFQVYSMIENHFLAKLLDGKDAIITDSTKATNTLNSLCIEIDVRYDLMKKARVRNIKEYNEKFINRILKPEQGHKYLPYLVIVIDEIGDLTTYLSKDFDLALLKIAQQGGISGVHLVISTNKITAETMPTSIKYNIVARAAFKVPTSADSKAIINTSGAEKLTRKGEFIFSYLSSVVKGRLIHLDYKDIESICSYIGSQQGYASAFCLSEYVDENSEHEIENININILDPMFEDAARLIVIHQQGSTSLIQRKFAIGYNHAGRIMDQLEKAGIVGPSEGSKARQVFCIDETDLEMRLRNLNQ